MTYCADCERLMLAAISASRIYHDLVGDLESAHIRRDTAEPFRLQQQVADALRNRDAAIKALYDHEHTHRMPAVAGRLGR
jgi:predicted Rdx family selenoprotein